MSNHNRKTDAEKLEREACKLFCIVFGAEEAREFESMNPAIYDGWLRLARKLKPKVKTCVWSLHRIPGYRRTSCGRNISDDCTNTWVFCPGCGGKIVTK